MFLLHRAFDGVANLPWGDRMYNYVITAIRTVRDALPAVATTIGLLFTNWGLVWLLGQRPSVMPTLITKHFEGQVNFLKIHSSEGWSFFWIHIVLTSKMTKLFKIAKVGNTEGPSWIAKREPGGPNYSGFALIGDWFFAPSSPSIFYLVPKRYNADLQHGFC